MIFTPDNLRECRHAAGLSQAGLADLFRVTERAVKYWEQGKSFPQGPARVLYEMLADGRLVPPTAGEPPTL